jgi:hypothetical protein
MVENDTMKTMKFCREVKVAVQAYQSPDAPNLKRFVDDFVAHAVPKTGATSLSTEKVSAWRGELVALVQQLKAGLAAPGETLHDITKVCGPTVATLATQEFIVAQLAPVYKVDGCRGHLIHEYGMMFINAIGTDESTKAFVDLQKNKMTKKTIKTAIEAQLRPMAKAWRKFSAFDAAGELEFFKIIAPGAEVDDIVAVGSWIRELTKKIDALVSTIFHFYTEPLESVKETLQGFVDDNYDKEGAAFLSTFGTRCLTKMTPGHNKIIAVIRELWHLDDHIGGISNLMPVWDDFANKCRVLSVKWGIYTLAGRIQIDSPLELVAPTQIMSPLKSISCYRSYTR